MDFRDWLNNGVAIAVLVVVGCAVWRMVKWAQPLVERVVGSHLELLGELKKQSPKIADAITKSAEATQEIKEVNQQIRAEIVAQTEEIKRGNAVLDAHNETFERIVGNQEEIKAGIRKLLPPGGPKHP